MAIARQMGERARARRRGLRMTLEQVGDLLGMSRAQVSRIETGKSGATIDVIERLAVILKIDVRELVAPDETARPDPEPPASELQRLAADVERSKPDKVGMVEGFLRAVLMLSTFTVIAGGLAATASQDGNDVSGRHNAYRRRMRNRKPSRVPRLAMAA